MFFIVSPQRLSTKCHFYACPSPGGSFFEMVGTLPAVGPVWVLCHEVSPVHTAMRNCTRDEGGPFEVGNQVLISSRRKLLSSKAMVVNVAEKSEHDFDRHG